MKKRLLRFGIIVLILSVIGVTVAPVLVSAADPIPEEVVADRTRNSKTTDLGDGSFALDATIGAIHYDDGSGWEEIDNEFVPAVAPWDWEMTKAGYNVKVLENFTAGQVLEFSKLGSTVNLQPMALEWTNDYDMIQQVSMPQDTTPEITNPLVDLLPAVGMLSHQGQIAWENAYGPGVDFEWQTTSTRLQKRLVISGLSDLPPPAQYIQDGGNPVLRYNLIFDPSSDVDIYVNDSLWDKSSKQTTFDIIEFRKGGEILWGFMPLLYWDSAGNEGQSIASVEGRGGSLYISIRVPYPWLQTATYPVFIDADIEELPEVGSDDILVQWTGEAWLGTLDHVWSQVGWVSGAERMGFGTRFPGINISSGSTIDAAKLIIYAKTSDASENVNTTIQGHDVDDSTPFSDFANYKNRRGIDGGTDFTTTASVAWNNIAAWTIGTDYDSPEIKSIIQEIVDRGGWASGQAITIFWDDHDDNSTHTGTNRRATYSRNGHASVCPKLSIIYTPAAPDAPTNFVASDNLSDRVTCTWTKPDGATKYQVYRDGAPIGAELGDVNTTDDVTAAAGTVTPGTATASDGTSVPHVTLSLAGEGINSGTTYSYAVRAGNAGGWSGDSNADNGNRRPEAITHQWQVDDGGGFDNIVGGTTDPYNYAGAPAPTITAGNAVATDGGHPDKVALSLAGTSSNDGVTYNYQCIVSSVGASNSPQTSDSNTGYRDSGALSYQWEAERGAGWGDIAGATGATHDDVGSPAGTVTPGVASASDGTSAAHVALSLAGEGINDGATNEYRCKLTAPDAANQTSGSDTGFRRPTDLTYQWYRSNADADAGYVLLGGATTDPHNDTGAPANGDGRYFQCVLSSTGASNSPQTSTVDRGYRLYIPPPPSPSVEISFTNGDTIVELFGGISDLGEPTISSRGFVWSLSSHGAPGNIAPGDTNYEYFWTEEGEFGSEQFSHLPQDLLVNTDYYGRAFIKVEGEYIYSADEIVFDPRSPPLTLNQTLIWLIPTVFTIFGVVVLFVLKFTPTAIIIAGVLITLGTVILASFVSAL